MQITVSASSWAKRWLENGSETVELPAGGTVSDVLALSGIPYEEIGLITRGGRVVGRDIQVCDGDVLFLLPVIIGG